MNVSAFCDFMVTSDALKVLNRQMQFENFQNIKSDHTSQNA